jgi:IstB-like ATP binding protein
MSKAESRHVYQLCLERTGRGSMIVTSNGDTAEWLAMSDDVLLAQSAVDRFKNAAYDFLVEGESYRPAPQAHARRSPAARPRVRCARCRCIARTSPSRLARSDGGRLWRGARWSHDPADFLDSVATGV